MKTHGMKKLYKNALDTIIRNKEIKESGKVNNIPFKNLNRLSATVPGIIKSNYIGVTAATGVGKTQFTKNIFIFNPIEYILENPGLGIDYKVLYFALEESKEEFIFTLTSYLMYKNYGIEISIMDLQSYTENRVTNDMVQKMKDIEPQVEEFLSRITIIDNAYTLSDIQNIIVQFNKDNPESDNSFTTIIMDHVSLLQPPTGGVLHSTISAWSNFAMKVCCKVYNYCVVNVHQQSMYGEDVIHFNAKRIEPSVANLADNKLIGRDYKQIFGIFGPFRFQIPSHRGYDVKQLRDNYRSFKVLKNRYGKSGISLGCFFKGACNYVHELPLHSKEEELQKIYDKIAKEDN